MKNNHISLFEDALPFCTDVTLLRDQLENTAELEEGERKIQVKYFGIYSTLKLHRDFYFID